MKSACSLVFLPAAAVAFGSISAGAPPRPPLHRDRDDAGSRAHPGASPRALDAPPAVAARDASPAVAPWRVVLDLGREPLARMPFDWARSGCRLPLVVPTDLAEDDAVRCRADAVSFTGPDGAVVRPVAGGEWSLSDDERTLTLAYRLPQALRRRDVYFEDDTELVLTGRVYAKREHDRLNDEYHRARDGLWQAGGEIGDIYDRRAASKKWDEASGRWVRRYEDASPFQVAQKRLQYWAAKAKHEQKKAERPDLQDLSERGPLPGVEGGVYIAKSGVVRVGHGGPVCGTWSAAPITNAPASYRGS